MSAAATLSVIHNGWRPFRPRLKPWTDETVYWAVRMDDRKPFPVIFERGDGRWREAATMRVIGHFNAPDFIAPLSSHLPQMPDVEVFHNPPSVVVMLVMSNRGLIVIRRGIEGYGFGKTALPGGFQGIGETWQVAGCREVFEETGVEIDPAKVRIYDVVTVQDGRINLVFGVYEGIVVDPEYRSDHEVIEAFEIDEPIEAAFPAHTDVIARYLAQIGKGEGAVITAR